MSFEYLHLQLIRSGARNIVAPPGNLYFTFNDKHWNLGNKDGHLHLEQSDPQHNLPSVVNQTFQLKTGDWKAVIKVLKDQPIPEEKPAHQHHKPKVK